MKDMSFSNGSEIRLLLNNKKVEREVSFELGALTTTVSFVPLNLKEEYFLWCGEIGNEFTIECSPSFEILGLNHMVLNDVFVVAERESNIMIKLLFE